MLQLICQWMIAALLTVGFFRGLYVDFHGAKAREPYGFTGAMITIVLMTLIALVYRGAGAFSLLPAGH